MTSSGDASSQALSSTFLERDSDEGDSRAYLPSRRSRRTFTFRKFSSELMWVGCTIWVVHQYLLIIGDSCCSSLDSCMGDYYLTGLFRAAGTGVTQFARGRDDPGLA